MDIISDELSKLYDLLLDEDELEDEDAFDEATDIVYDVIGELEESGAITEIPEEGSPDTTQAEWVAKYLPMIQAEIETRLNDEDEED